MSSEAPFSTFNASVSEDGVITLQWRNKDDGVLLIFSADGSAQVSRKGGRGDFKSANVEDFDPREGLPPLRLNAPAVDAKAFDMQGHNEPCYYCGEPCNGLAGDPGLWPLPFCHRDEPGVMKWHHTRCVTRLLPENAALLSQPSRAAVLTSEDRKQMEAAHVWVHAVVSPSAAVRTGDEHISRLLAIISRLTSAEQKKE